ncbi:MAG: hypothetical protein RLO01_20490 [Thalassobaculaceae bacterium]
MLAIFAIALRIGLGVSHALAASGLPADQRGIAFDLAASTCLAAAPVSQPIDGSQEDRSWLSGPVCPVCFGSGHPTAILPTPQVLLPAERLFRLAFVPAVSDLPYLDPAVERPRPRAPPIPC